MCHHPRITTLLSAFFGVTFAIHASAGSPIYLGSKSAGDVSVSAIDHSEWSTLLKKYVNDDGLVDYKAWKASSADVKKLDVYIASLSTGSLSAPASRPAKLAFFINAYNAVTVKGILREYPTTSIRNHTAKLFGYNIWHDLKLYVGGTPFSLDEMEHKVLRKMSEPRIHFAIVCASIGCPRLLNEAYVAEKIDEQLDRNAKDFFTRSRNFKFDARSNLFSLSSILDWFGEDFGSTQSSQLKKIAKWIPDGPAKTAASTGNGDIRYLDYDWGLNKR